MKSFRCNIRFETEMDLDQLTEKISQVLFGGLPFNKTGRYQCPGAEIEYKLFGLGIGICKSGGNIYEMEIISRPDVYYEKTEADILSENGFMEYISKLLSNAGLSNKPNLLKDKLFGRAAKEKDI